MCDPSASLQFFLCTAQPCHTRAVPCAAGCTAAASLCSACCHSTSVPLLLPQALHAVICCRQNPKWKVPQTPLHLQLPINLKALQDYRSVLAYNGCPDVLPLLSSINCLLCNWNEVAACAVVLANQQLLWQCKAVTHVTVVLPPDYGRVQAGSVTNPKPCGCTVQQPLQPLLGLWQAGVSVCDTCEVLYVGLMIYID